MKVKVLFSLILFSLFSFVSSVSGEGRLDIVIKPSELSRLLNHGDVLIIEATEPAIYEESHIPNSRLLPISWIKNSVDKDFQRKTGLPIRPEKVEEMLRNLGVDDDSRVIIYDSGQELDKGAGLVWTLLTIYGMERVQILAGGKKRWADEGYPLIKAKSEVKPSSYKVSPKKDMVVTADWILRNLESGIKLLDARLPDEFAGESSMGHLPGAINLQWHELQDSKETFKSSQEISEILARRGITRDSRIVTYCNWGPKASFLFSALKSLGYSVQIYWGGIDEWSSDGSLPVVDESSK